MESIRYKASKALQREKLKQRRMCMLIGYENALVSGRFVSKNHSFIGS